MLSWLRRRRQRNERIKALAEMLISQQGGGAYEEARLMGRNSLARADRRIWKRVASTIRRRTGKRGGNIAIAILGAALLIVLTPGSAFGAVAQEVHYSPEEPPDAIDATLISGATRSIDFASYVGASRRAASALNRRGFKTPRGAEWQAETVRNALGRAA